MGATLRVIGSGSTGNGYILQCNDDTLLIELGVSWETTLKALDFKLENICGCIVTHGHLDHSKSIPQALSYFLPVYSCSEVAEKYKGVKLLEVKQKHRIGNFSVLPFSLPHNAENYGYIIEHPEMGKMVFATDCSSFRYKIHNVNHWLIECNYSENILIDNECNGTNYRSASQNHLELSQCIEALKVNYSVDLRTIVLLHLSNGNSDAEGFKKDVRDNISFDNVYVADKGLEIDLDKEQF